MYVSAYSELAQDQLEANNAILQMHSANVCLSV